MGRPLTEETLEQLQKAMDAADAAKPQDDDACSVVSNVSILSDVKSVRSVHSSRSIAAIRKRMAAKKKKNSDALSCLDDIREEPLDLPECPEPVIVQTQEDVRLKNKFEPSRLPYIHRNPAV